MRFAGHAVLWNRADRAGDVFRRGAFAAGSVPLLWQHGGASVGSVAVRPDAAGLAVDGTIEDVQLTELVRSGALTGLSVGYRARDVRTGAWREILDAELVEVSLVA